MRVLAIDPGLRGCGVAVYLDGTLEHAWYTENPERVLDGPAAWEIMSCAVFLAVDRIVVPLGTPTPEFDVGVFEVPQVYRLSRQKGDPNDLISLAGVVGSVSASMPCFKRIGVHPAQWKGQVPKAIHHKRIVSSLSANEKKSIQLPSKSLQHNVWDAIGLAQWWVQRAG